MAQHHDHRGTMVPQDTNFDNADQPGIAQPYTQSEVEELLYGDDRPASERLARLRELRDESAIRESGDWGGQDPAAMLDELDRAIDELSAMIANGDDGEAYAGLATNFDNDPADRLDALSPDDEDGRHAIEGDDEVLDEEDEAALLEEPQWDGGDEFRTDKDFH
ncbi:MAG: hypothetical protein KJ944_16515 [Alphaproteobacteria bacterium]|jgi:hypothetical protein|uniref:hypothetical protein n=1 Tax=Devosia sp. XGJD_8 TaxID=3391187 RepID=UPI001D83FFF2|nr:hypothetical protein [Alphaproteobacteria bacterium]MBU1563003.1 hypothetical protein [Alphaproteobacteria bacterium]MBU2304198.1 hypothetical protein [Alphaproteobacteria bacterium]